MKFPGKRLIVEYKNRRVRKDAKSLWGDINLQEISRAIEDEAAPPLSSEPVRKSRNVAIHKQARPILSSPATNESPAPLPDNAATGRILPALNEAVPTLHDRDQLAAVPGKETEVPPVIKQETSKATPSSVPTIQSVQKPEKPASRADTEAETARQAEEILPPVATVSSPLAPEKELDEQHRDRASTKPSTTDVVVKKDPSVADKKVLKREVTARKPAKAKRVKSSVTGSQDSVAEPGFYSLPKGLSDDLKALEKENAELKHRLAETLRKENAQLERMMVRAASPIGE